MYNRYRPRFSVPKRRFRRNYRPSAFKSKVNKGAIAFKMVKQMQKSVETKYNQGFNAGVVIPAAGNFSNAMFFTGIQEGTADTERIGEKITIKSLSLRYSIKVDPNQTGNSYRLMLVLDRRPNGAWPSLNNILTGDDIYGQIQLNTQFKGRFQILMNKIINTNLNQTGLVGKYYKKMNLKTEYNGNGNTIGEASKNHFFLYICKKDDHPVALPDIFDVAFRVAFTDQ